MNYRSRPNEENFVFFPVPAHFQFGLTEGQIFPLLRDFMPYELRPDVGFYDVALPHVPHSEHQAGDSVPVTNDGVSRKKESLGPFFRPGEFGEYYAYHEGLDHDSCYTLQAHYEDGFGAFFRRGSSAVPYGVLGFDAEEETGSEALDVLDAGGPRFVVLESSCMLSETFLFLRFFFFREKKLLS